MVTALGALLLVVAVVAFILHPLVAGRHAPMEKSDDEMSDAESRRRVKLLALRDVEYDFATGKLDDEDYRSLKRELSAEALEALEASEKEAEGIGSDALEAEISVIRKGLESGTVCEVCGHANPGGSRFCSGCGSALARESVGSGSSGSGGGE